LTLERIFVMTRSDRLIGSLFVIFGCVVVLEASKLEFASSYGAGSGFFPHWLGVAIFILGAVVTLQAWRNPALVDSSAPVGWSVKRLIALALLVSFVLTLEWIGFVTAFSLMVALLLKLEGEHWRHALSMALTAGVSFYVFFIRLLAVNLPTGPFGF
jgi:Tripartite tricarboxylate transporter TctB family